MRVFHCNFINRLFCLVILLSLVCLLHVYLVDVQRLIGFRRWQASYHFKAGIVNTTALSPMPTKKPECFPAKQILFLKTHKTGSSTMANIFFRYGDARNLTFVLGSDTLLGWPGRFRITHPMPIYGHPDILCSHARFNKKPMNWLFPLEISKYVTILRNPVDNFESVFNFARLGKSFGLGDNPNYSLEKYLAKPIPFYSSPRIRKDVMMHLARNPMMFDLGLSLKYYQNRTAVNEYIQFLDKEFDLVMIMDYFDESLVLMKRMLCWEIDDILYVKLNERQDKEKAIKLSVKVKENIRRWNKADVLLFDYFNATFWRKIKMEGPSFHEDLSAFRQRKQEIKQLCLTNGTRLQRTYRDKFVKGYTIKSDLNPKSKAFCEKLVRSENHYLAFLRNKHMERLRNVEPDRLTRKKEETGWHVASDLRYVPV